MYEKKNVLLAGMRTLATYSNYLKNVVIVSYINFSEIGVHDYSMHVFSILAYPTISFGNYKNAMNSYTRVTACNQLIIET